MITKKSRLIVLLIIVLILLICTLLKIISIYRKNINTVTAIEVEEINVYTMGDKNNNSNEKYEILDYSELSYYIKVNIDTQIVTVYTCDENGEYNIAVKNMLCSTGTATPKSGIYKISDKYEWRLLVGNVYGQYATRITGSILFHSVPYLKKDKSTLEYWEYDKLGQPASKGCVRLTVEDAKWIYSYCGSDTYVEFCREPEQEGSIKPSAIKISKFSDELRNWDPTDPDKNNPWLNYEEINKGENEK